MKEDAMAAPTVERTKLAPTETAPKTSNSFIPTGSTLLDLALGGGWAQNRVFNIVGDKSSGKTLLAIEGYANFNRMYPQSRMRYGEAEAAFDDIYAQKLGYPTEVSKPDAPLETVEDFFKDLQNFSKIAGPSFYILDSLDALSDEAEKARDADDDATYGVAKAKKMSELFRRQVQTLSNNKVTLGVISQVRENIGVMFGEKYTRSGGKALDFYSSQIVWLSEIEKVKRTVRDQELVTGVNVRAKVKKNKAGIPFREANFKIVFGYGIDDEISMLEWLGTIKAFTKEESAEKKKELERARSKQDHPAITQIREALCQRTKIEWGMLEEALAPKIRKYN
jgi:recombination protein RecA